VVTEKKKEAIKEPAHAKKTKKKKKKNHLFLHQTVFGGNIRDACNICNDT